jgi:hypothetical protein
MTLRGATRWTHALPSVLPPESLSSTNSSPRTSNLPSWPYLVGHASANACSSSASDLLGPWGPHHAFNGTRLRLGSADHTYRDDEAGDRWGHPRLCVDHAISGATARRSSARRASGFVALVAMPSVAGPLDEPHAAVSTWLQTTAA